MKNILNKVRRYALPGAITLVVALLVLVIKGIWPFGPNRIDYFDNMQQVAPLYAHLWDWMHGDASLWFDWYTGLGTNVSMSISAFSMLSPFNIILYFVPRELILESISIFTVVKMVFMAVAMYAYMEYKYESLRYGLKVLMSIMYAFCGYVLIYGSCFTPWMDIVALFPLLMLSYERMLNKGKKLFYIVMVALVFIINYYVSAMAILYILVISGAYIFLRCEKENRKRTVWNLGLGTVTGIGLSAFVLVPVLVQLSGSQRGSSGSSSLVGQYINWLTTSIAGEGTMSAFQRWVMLYGMALAIAIVLIGLAKYSSDKKVLKYNIVVIVASLTPMFIEAVNIIWHFGSYNGYTLRNGFLIAFTLISVAGYYGQLMFAEKKFNVKEMLIQAVVALVYIVAFIVIHNIFPVLWESSVTSLILVEVVVMTVVYIWYLTKTKDKLNYKRVLVLAAAELFVGAFALIGPPKCYTYWPFQYGDYVQYANEIKAELDINESATDRITNPDISLNANYPLIIRKGALSSFTAALESDTQASAKRLGYSKYFLWALDSGGTVFTESLLHVTQAVNTNPLDEDLYTEVDSYEGFKLYDSKYILPFATTVNSKLAQAEFGDDWVKNHNILYGALTGSDDVLVTVPEYIEEDIKATDMGYKAFYSIKVEGKQAVYVSVVDTLNEDRDMNVSRLYRKINIFVNGKPVDVPEIGDVDNPDYTNDYNNHLIYLGCFQDEVVNVSFNYDLSQFEDENLRKEILESAKVTIANLDMNKMDALVKKYKSAYCDTSYTNDSLTVKVKGSGNNNMALIPVIYSDNWTVTVNGKEVQGKAIAGLFTGVELENGQNTIVMEFAPKGRNVGFIITLAIALMLIACLVVNSIREIKIPKWIESAVFAVYTLVYVVLLVVMFIIPGVLWFPMYMKESISIIWGMFR